MNLLVARNLNLAPEEGFNHMLLVLQLGMDRHSLIKGAMKPESRECRDLATFTCNLSSWFV